MSKIKAVILALVAVFAFAAIAASSAFAGEWLIDSAAVTAATSVDSQGLVELEDMTFGTVVHCEGTDEGTVGPGAADSESTIVVSGCINIKGCTSPVVKPLHLPWKTEIVLGTETRDKLETSGAGAPGYEVSCGSGGFFEKESCTGTTSTGIANEANGTVKATFDANSEAGNCTFGGNGAGLVRGEIFILTLDGLTLAVS